MPFTHIFLLIKHNENRSAGRASSLTRLLKILKVSRMLKLFKLAKLMNGASQWDDDPSHQLLADGRHFVHLIMGVLLMAHLAACIFALIADGGGTAGDGWGAQTWVADYFNDGHALYKNDDDDFFLSEAQVRNASDVLLGDVTAAERLAVVRSAAGYHRDASYPDPWRLYVVALSARGVFRACRGPRGRARAQVLGLHDPHDRGLRRRQARERRRDVLDHLRPVRGHVLPRLRHGRRRRDAHARGHEPDAD